MTADRSFRLLVALAAVAVLVPAALAWRLLPCQEIAGLALHKVGAACRLLADAGLAAPLPVGISLIGVVAAAVALSVARLSRELQRAHHLEERFSRNTDARVARGLASVAERVGAVDRLSIVRHATPRAFCAGFFRPRVYLTTGPLAVLTEPELEAVVRHEVHHAQRRDPLRMAIARALAWAVFYLPVLRDFESHFLVAKEVEADRVAVSAMGTRDALAGALRALVDQRSSCPAGAAAFDVTAARIDALVDGEAPPLRTSAFRVGLSLLAVLAAVCLVLG